MNRRISKLLEISVFNTIRMNYHYFGWGVLSRATWFTLCASTWFTYFLLDH